MKAIRNRCIYLAMVLPGLVAPWWLLGRYLTTPQAGPGDFARSLFANPAAGAASADLLVSALVFLLFVYIDGTRLRMRMLWLYPLLTFGVGLSVGLPVYLYYRNRTQADD